MLKIRLARVGRKHDPSYRIIVTEKGRGPQTGAYHEKLGTYDARSDEYELKDERIEHWLSEGAQPSDTVHNLLVKAEIIDDDTVNPLPNKSPVTPDEEEEDEVEKSGSKKEHEGEGEPESGDEETDQEEGGEDNSETEDDSNDEVEASVSEPKSRSSGEESDTENDTDEQDNEVNAEDDGRSEEDQEEES
ncbi:MAG: 30S ribosomal protein S16 [Parcubacteria group bacterium SW_6_46_9]|nr:MAG: 30S ribosomal protein S16 [Parcubacteria group bacterium SW_6_46_9]